MLERRGKMKVQKSTNAADKVFKIVKKAAPDKYGKMERRKLYREKTTGLIYSKSYIMNI